MTQEYRYIGKATPRLEARDIVSGRARYADDYTLPDMLHGRVLRSPLAHALIKRIDTSAAQALPGVKAIVTHENCPEWITGMPAHKRVLDPHLTYVGDAVALVAALTPEIADEALSLIRVEYEELPHVLDVEEARAEGAAQIHPNFFKNNTVERGCMAFGPNALQEIVMGDIEDGMAESDFVVEGTVNYETISNPLPPESPSIICWWDGPHSLQVQGCCQSPHLERMIAQLAIPDTTVRVVSTAVGGSYGSKNTVPLEMLYAAAMAKQAGRPVKLTDNKEEHLSTFLLRLGSRMHAKVGFKNDGTVHALDAEWLVGSGSHSDFGNGQIANGCGRTMLLLNKCKHWNFQPHLIVANRCRSGGIRGFGGQEAYAALIPILTLGMEKLNMDPTEFFKKNFNELGDGFYWVEGKWWTNQIIDYKHVVDHGAEAFGWKDKWKGWLRPTAINGRKARGVGMSVHGSCDSGMAPTRGEAFVKLEGWGSVTIISAIAESGMGQRSAAIKFVAESLNLPMEKVNIIPPDSQCSPYDWGLAGSRGTYAIGKMLGDACEEVKTKLLAGAAQIFNVPVEMLETKDGMISIIGHPEATMPWIAVLGPQGTIIGHGEFEEDFSKPCFMAAFVEVEVDLDTGMVELVRVLEATDAGQIIDPLNCAMQLHGGLGACGVDTAINEETVIDKKTGKMLNCNMIDFKWRTFPNLPVYDTVIDQTPMPTSRFKAIGVGEITGAPLPSAVMMAVNNAIGARVPNYPLTPANVLKAMGKA